MDNSLNLLHRCSSEFKNLIVGGHHHLQGIVDAIDDHLQKTIDNSFTITVNGKQHTVSRTVIDMDELMHLAYPDLAREMTGADAKEYFVVWSRGAFVAGEHTWDGEDELGLNAGMIIDVDKRIRDSSEGS